MSIPNRALPPSIHKIGHINMPEVRCSLLPNGISVVIYDHCDQEVHRISAVRGGGIAESINAALPQISVALQRDGSRMLSGAQIADNLDYNGSWLKNTALSHHTNIVASSLNSHIGNTLPVIRDLLFYPTFPASELQLVKQRHCSALAVMQQEVSYHSNKLASELIMGKSHPLAKGPSTELIQSITREQVADFFNQWNTPANTTLYISGSIPASVEDYILKVFAEVEHSKAKTPHLNIVPFSPQGFSKIHFIERPGAKQSSVNIMLPAIKRTHPDYSLLHIVVAALGGYFGSRLMMNIREDKGYTYSIAAMLLGYLDDGVIQITAECDNAYVMPLIEETRYELRRMAQTPLSVDELHRLIQVETTNLLDILDSPFSFIDYLQSKQTIGITDEYFNQRLTLLQTISPEDIMEISRKYLNPDNAVIVVAGDKI